MDWILLALAAATFVSTLAGGIVTLKLRNFLPYFFAFSSGSLIAVTFFDILPEGISIAQASGVPIRSMMIAVVASFFVYSLIEKYALTHHFHDKQDGSHSHIMGPVGAGGLIFHSFLDGVAIGTAYQANAKIGLIVAIAVIFHDFTDGINTVTVMLKNRQHPDLAKLFLLLDAFAPLVGVGIAYVLAIQEAVLPILLSIFAGEFLYIGAANLLPETHKHAPGKMILSMATAILLILLLTSVL